MSTSQPFTLPDLIDNSTSERTLSHILNQLPSRNRSLTRT
jgi:hypothetical protein